MDEVSNDKINNLRDIILSRADSEKKELLAKSHQEADDWLQSETEKLGRETSLIIQDAHKRAEDIRRRQILAAERDKSTETLRLQNRIISDALEHLQDRLIQLRERADYIDILCGMCIDAASSLKESSRLKFRLSAVDAKLADKMIEKLSALDPKVEFLFDQEPAPILGGCLVLTEDNRRQVNSDWQSLTQESADTLAERLLPLL